MRRTLTSFFAVARKIAIRRLGPWRNQDDHFALIEVGAATGQHF